MPLLLIFLGVVLLVSAVRGTTSCLFKLLTGDFAGSNNFLIWTGAIVGIGALGYIKELRVVANGLLTLVIIALFLANKGFFANYQSAFMSTQSASTTPSTSSTASQGTSTAPQNVYETWNGELPEIQAPVYPSLPTPNPETGVVLY